MEQDSSTFKDTQKHSDDEDDEISGDTHINERTSISVQVETSIPPTNAKLYDTCTQKKLDDDEKISGDIPIHIEEKTSINVQVDDETPILLKLPPDAKDHESELFLFEILTDKNSLKIQREPDWAKINENCNFEYGLNFTSKGPSKGKEKAVEILDILYHSVTMQSFGCSELVECKEAKEKLCILNYLASSQLPFSPVSMRLGGSMQSTSQKNDKEEITIYRKDRRIMAILKLNESDIKPTKKFEDAVDEALRSNDPRKSLENVTEQYGQFFCKGFEIGGIILSIGQNKKITNLRIGKINPINYSNDGDEFFQMCGGLENRYLVEGMRGWLDSLKNYKNWRVAEYFDICSIFDILDEERRTKVATALGRRIIDSQVVKLELVMDISKPDPFIYQYKIPKEYDLSDCQIFVTEMKDDNSDTIFASRVHYINDKESPVILLYRLGKLKKQPAFRRFSVKLGLSILGISTILNLDGQNLVFESGESLITVKDEHCSAIITSRKLNPHESLLATCVSRSNSFTNADPLTSKYLARYHFVYNDGAIEACAFFYDLEKRELFYQLDNLNTTFSISYSIISGQRNNKFGQAQITSESCITGIKSKRYKILFDSYRDLTQSCLRNPIFVNLILNKCPKYCPHGVFNITPDYAEFKYIIDVGFFNTSLKNMQIVYFCAPYAVAVDRVKRNYELAKIENVEKVEDYTQKFETHLDEIFSMQQRTIDQFIIDEASQKNQTLLKQHSSLPEENELDKIKEDDKQPTSDNDSIEKVKDTDTQIFETHLEFKKDENSSIQQRSIEESQKSQKLLKLNPLLPEGNEFDKIEENDLYFTKLQVDKHTKILKQPLTLIKEKWEEKFKLMNGIIIDKYTIEQSIDPAIDYKYSSPIIEYKKSQNMKISYVSKICDSFMLSEGIEIDASSSEDLKNFFMLFNMNPRKHSENAFLNDLETNDIYCEIASEQILIEYNIQNIKITDKLKAAVEKALKSNTPIEDLKHVFNELGHLFATKIIIGNKLQRIVRLNGENTDKENKRLIYLPEFNELGNETLNRWKEEIQPHDSSYLFTIDGGLIEINKIPKWLETVSLCESEWHIIKRVVTPLYKILDINQQQKIEKFFSKQDYLLMTNTTTILDFNTGYQRIKFNNKLKSRNYQIFGKFVNASGQTFTNIYVKFSLKSEYGFSVNWIQAGDINFLNFLRILQKPYKLEWMLIGCPSEIGYFYSTARDKEIKTGSTELKIKSKKEEQPWSCQINIDKSLSLSSAVSLNIEYPITRKTPIFKASYQILPESLIEVRLQLQFNGAYYLRGSLKGVLLETGVHQCLLQ
ncbi:1565_t:CDS:10 [Ambispora gerdemannii]|uniref:1565_t:CDS:1 n=1 Tax=Ambispora gerdemannii TaxID=144530 RepID=A0A9N9GAT8_9GLOM|nr:1565_t:CDS:10 [Ambispora gerdemannii]